MSKDKVFLTANELVERWSGAVKAGTLANWRNQGKGPAYQKLGSKVLYPLSKVVEWKEKNIHNGQQLTKE